MANWHTLSSLKVLELLKTTSNGLAHSQAQARLQAAGPNEIMRRTQRSALQILAEQFEGTMMLILAMAAVISIFLGDYRDALAVFAIIILNALLGFFQESRAERALAALSKLAVPTVRIRRSGQIKKISARELVPGDVVLLEAGNKVPADGRLLTSVNLKVQEAALTGESQPVEKNAEAVLTPDTALAERINMVFMGTVVSYGRGEAVITETGMSTQLGHIAELVESVDRRLTPLQRRVNRLGKELAVAALLLVALIFVLGIWRGEGLRVMFLTAVSMAVAAVPEGLPAIMTIALALGAQRMLHRKALIRKLPSVETLGSVTVICADKTGTLTENRMSVGFIRLPGMDLDLSDVERSRGEESAHDRSSGLQLLLAASAACNDAHLVRRTTSQDSDLIGDPTETALLQAAERFGISKEELESELPRLSELPFNPERKRMTTVHRLSEINGEISGLLRSLAAQANLPIREVAFTKGAKDQLLPVCGYVLKDGAIEELSEAEVQRVNHSHDELASQGMRVLAFALGLLERGDDRNSNSVEQDLVFLGLMGIVDPHRSDVPQAVRTCREAGIKPVMITGDHPLTAQHIARQIGILQAEKMMLGQDLERTSAAELESSVDQISVYARVSPEHKLKIVEAWQNRGHVVAMTGDGVNDAPALRKADVGVAMGITGTDVAKEAADMVLLDDNFSTIVAAVREGRVIYDNLRKFIKYLMTTNSSELTVMLLGPLMGMPLPLLPLQILWINLVTDGFPALALSVEPAEEGTMHRPPHSRSESILSRGLGRHVLWAGLLMGFVSLAVGFLYWRNQHSGWQTALFTTVSLSQMAHVLAVRSERQSLFHLGFLSNKMLSGAVLLTLFSQLFIMYFPLAQSVFQTRALPWFDLLICSAASSVIFWAVEVEKWLVRREASV
ncbi:MAG: cation-translocating P-type ATPase [Acidobacteria bacterium]|nr:cation-translocating P-type ATPase [Acidobacteriota bacterium]